MIVTAYADVCDQQNVLRWEDVDPPWVLPNYVGELAQHLQTMKAWIATRGTVVGDPPAPVKNASNGKSEVPGSEDAPPEDLPSPHQLLPKVLQSNQVEHVLNKGAWATTPAIHQGWKIFINVSANQCWSSLY